MYKKRLQRCDSWLLVCVMALLSVCGSLRAQCVRVDRVDSLYVVEPLLKDNTAASRLNTQRMYRIMQRVGAGATILFPAGAYYFDGSALPNGATIESTAPGQIFRGEGVGTTRIYQCNVERDFGFQCDTARKRVPTATLRVRHKGCRVEQLTLALSPHTPFGTIAGSAALQIGHIAYMKDRQIGIVETTGIGADFLLDHVIVSQVDVGEHLGQGILSDRFFEVGIDIIGSGGHVRVSGVQRLDARTGIRLDNGNHCGQGEYQFDGIYCMGNPSVFRDGVFFDWVGGQAPSIHNCSCSFTSGLHAGPRGKFGDRLSPTIEAEVVRSSDRNWDWLTLHGHAVAADPDPAQRTAWYGLPRWATVVRVTRRPASDGEEWREGRDFTIERMVGADSALSGASRIHWLGDAPKAGEVYYVTFRQPDAYRVHDLQWGSAINLSVQEAAQVGGFAVHFTEQGVGYLNPDFRFGVGYNFVLSDLFVINGDLIFDDDVDLVNLSGLSSGVCTLRIGGVDANRSVRRISVNNSTLRNVELGAFSRDVRLLNNFIDGTCRIQASLSDSVEQVCRKRGYRLDAESHPVLFSTPR